MRKFVIAVLLLFLVGCSDDQTEVAQEEIKVVEKAEVVKELTEEEKRT